MIYLNPCVQKSKKRSDGSYVGYICFTRERQMYMYNTGIILKSNEVTKNLSIRSCRSLNLINEIMVKFQARINDLEARNLIGCKSLRQIVDLCNAEQKHVIDVIAEILDIANEISNENTKFNYLTTRSSLMKFMGTDSLDINEVTLKFLNDYTLYLQHKRMSPASIRNYISNLKASINRIRAKYNNPEIGEIVIPYNPFERYKMPSMPISNKKALPPEIIRMIANIPDDTYYNNPSRSLLNFIRDMFMLSFYTRGTNTIDFMMMKKSNMKKGRLEFERTKTMNRRMDRAFTSIKLEPEALEIIYKYPGDGDRLLCIGDRFSSERSFRTAIRQGMIALRDYIDYQEMSFYSARHSWATIARNDIGADIDDVAKGLNHASALPITDIYIKPDLSRIDELNRKVIDFVLYERLNK